MTWPRHTSNLTLPNIGVVRMYPSIRRSAIPSRWKNFCWDVFFTFHNHIFDTFWPNFMAVSLQLSRLWSFFVWRCSQNNDFTVKTLHKCQIPEKAVEYEQIKIYTWNFVRILIFIRVLRLSGFFLQFSIFSLPFYCSPFFSNNRTTECQ